MTFWIMSSFWSKLGSQVSQNYRKLSEMQSILYSFGKYSRVWIKQVLALFRPRPPGPPPPLDGDWIWSTTPNINFETSGDRQPTTRPTHSPMSAETATDWRPNSLYLYSTPGFETTPNTTVEFSSTSTQRQSSPAKITSLRENTKLISALIIAAAVIFVICGAVLLVCLKKRWVSATYSLWMRDGYKCEHLTDCCYFRMAEQRITVIRTRDPLQITGSREQGNSFGLPYMNVYSKRKIPHSSSLCFDII